MNELNLEFLIWRKVYDTTCMMYIYGHMREEVFIKRCKQLGMLDHEIHAELLLQNTRRAAIEIEADKEIETDLERKLENQS